MSRVMVVSHKTPRFPGPGAETRAYCLARELARDFDMTFVLPDLGSHNRLALEALESVGVVEAVSFHRKWLPVEWRVRQAVQRLEPVRTYSPIRRTPGMVRAMSTALPAIQSRLDTTDWSRFDLVHVILPQTALLLGRSSIPVPKTLDWVDEHSVVVRRELELEESRAKRIAHRLEIGRIRRFQTKIAPLFDCSFVASEVDADRLAQCTGGQRPRVVPNGVDADYFCNARPERPPGNTLIYTGHMSYGPNIDAVQFFCRKVLPLVLKEVPDVRLMIVGTSPDESVTALEHDYPNLVTVTGEVADVRPYLTQAAVSMVPLRAGGGTRLKILESLAMHRPVVTTGLGCEGLEMCDGEHVLIRDDVEAFASAVVGLLKDPIRWRSLAERGEALVRREYSWGAIASDVAATWLELIDLHRGQKGSW